MKAMVLEDITPMNPQASPLRFMEVPTPEAAPGQLLLKVSVCGVCHTELDEIEGRTPPSLLPMVLGHQVVGRVAERPHPQSHFKLGDRLGVAWIYSACGQCEYCQTGRENLCSEFVATGRDAPGGYAEYMCVDEQFVYAVPQAIGDVEAAPLLCAGAIGHRSLSLTGLQNGQWLGLTGFGSSAHLVLQLVQHQFPQSPIYVFARSKAQQQFAAKMGAHWVGHTSDTPPHRLHAIIDTTPAWQPVVMALEHLLPGGRLVINAIRKENRDKDHLQSLDYARHVWQEKEIKSVANVTRSDVQALLDMAAEIPLRPKVQTYPLVKANEALQALKQGAGKGAKVLVMSPSGGP